MNALDQASDLTRRLARAFGKLTDLVSHHRESSALLSGSRGFDGSVQCQEIGLCGDVIDHRDDLADFL
jgi:hypothetical protein